MLSGRQMGGAQYIIQHSGAFYNGYKVPLLGFGTYRIPAKDAYISVLHALRNGYRHFDCAKVYGNEAAVGRALKDGMKDLGIQRNELFITSKLWNTDHHPDKVQDACLKTIDRLQVGYLDLYLMHWPVCWKTTTRRHHHQHKLNDNNNVNEADDNADDLHPIDEMTGQHLVDSSITLADTWKAMEDLTKRDSKVRWSETGIADFIAEGGGSRGTGGIERPKPREFEPLVRSLGVSNFSQSDIYELFDEKSKMDVAPVCNQVELHPGLPQTGLKPINGMFKMVTVAYCPLGMPTRFTPPDFKGVVNDPFFKFFQEKTGFGPSRLLLNWSADLGHVILVKSTNPDRIKDNAKTQRFSLRDAQRYLFDSYHTINPIRVINPTTFRGDGKPFFQDPPASKARQEMAETYRVILKKVREQAEQAKNL